MPTRATKQFFKIIGITFILILFNIHVDGQINKSIQRVITPGCTVQSILPTVLNASYSEGAVQSVTVTTSTFCSSYSISASSSWITATFGGNNQATLPPSKELMLAQLSSGPNVDGFKEASERDNALSAVSNSYVNIYLKANTGSARTGYVYIGNFTVTINQAAAPVTPPVQPGVISGPSNVCTGTNAIYSISPVAGVTSYTWSVNGIAISGQTNANASLPFSTVGNTTVSVVANNIAGTSPSRSISVAVNSAPSAPSVIDGSVSACNGINTNYTVGAVPNATNYTWSFVGGTISSGQGTSNITAQFTSTGTVSVIAVNGCGTSAAFSKNVTVVNKPTIPVTINGLDAACGGSSTSFSIAAVPGATNYSWLVEEGSIISGQGTTQVAIQLMAAGSETIFVSATNGCGAGPAQSKPVTIKPIPSTPIAVDVAHCGAGSVTLSATSGSNGNMIRWYTASSGGSHLTTSLTYATPVLSGTTTYYATSYEKFVGCESSGRLPVRAIISPLTVITVHPTSTSVCEGDLTSFAVVASGAGTLSYQWELSSNGGTSWTPIGGATAASYSLTASPALQGYQYHCIATSATCGSATSSAATLSVNLKPAIPTAITGPDAACGGSSASFSIAAVPGATGYSWMAEEGSITSGQGTTQVAVHLLAGGSETIFVSATNGCGAGPTQNKPVTVTPIPSIPTGADASRCGAGSVTLNAAFGSNGNAIRWYSTSTGGSPLATVSSYETPALSSTTTYYAASYNRITGCESIGRFPVRAIVNPLTVITVHPTSATVCESNQAIFNVEASDTGPYTYQWQQSTDGGATWGNVGGNSASYTTGATAISMNGFQYRCTITGTCNLATSSIAALSVTPNPTLLQVAYTPPVLNPATNYVHETLPQKEMTSATLEAVMSGANKTFLFGDITNTVSYFDGLGRPIQTVGYRSSPTGRDVVSPVAYNDLGQEPVKYLPYTGGYTGGYQPNALGTVEVDPSSAQHAFYLNTAGVATDPYPYSRTVFEASPLSRVLEQGAPSAKLQPLSPTIPTSGGSTKLAYGTNTAGEVTLWRISSDSVLVADGSYAPGTLYLTQATDPEGFPTKEWKDMDGRVLLKQATVDATTIATTAYVYDDFGRLRYVLPPKFIAERSSATSFTPSNALVKSYGYYYAYDNRGRMAVKQLPGAAPVYMVYDAADRLTLTQDGEQRVASRWSVTRYDALGRPVLTGEISLPTKTHAALQAAFASDTARVQWSGTAPTGYTLTGLLPASLGKTITTSDLLTVSYYDSYKQLTLPAFTGLGYDASLAGFSAYTDADGVANGYFDRILGQPTGALAKVLDGTELTATGRWLGSASYYDDKYRPIQQRSALYEAGCTQTVATRYRFNGLVDSTAEVVRYGALEVQQRTLTAYDHAGRVTKSQLRLNGQAAQPLATLRYNELGQLLTKTVGDNLEQISYRYTIQGWLNQLNDPANPGSSCYAQALAYDRRGNITSMQWATPSGQEKALQRYDYSYDGLSRLTQGSYSQPTAGLKANGYNEALTYDLNGNITGLNRYAPQGAAAGVIDQLAYRYAGNQLTGVTDNASTYKAQGYLDGSTLAVDRTYDALGRMVTDKDRGVAVAYNQLSLPKQVTNLTDATDKISYIYDATGRKLAARNAGKTTIYAGSLVIDSAATGEKVAFLLNGEGRMIPNGTSTFRQEYFLKDHLGNTRAVVARNTTSGAKELVSSSSYYPFGLEMADQTYQSGTANPYRYNGKELQTFMEVAGRSLEWYDYGNRFYMPDLGRFIIQDRFAEKYHDMTLYQYGANNPILFIDVNGDSVSVAKQYQEQFNKTLATVFGDNAKNFSYTKTGMLTYNGTEKDFKGDAKDVFGQLNGTMNESTTTDIIYEESTQITLNDGTKVQVKASDGGGAVTVLASENKVSKNTILISPTAKAEFNVFAVTPAYYKTPIDPNNGARFTETKVQSNQTDLTFHELGHVVNSGKSQDRVINFNNLVRKIIGLNPRPYDETHNSNVTKGNY